MKYFLIFILSGLIFLMFVSCGKSDKNNPIEPITENTNTESTNTGGGSSAGTFFDDFESDTVGQMPAEWAVRYSGESLKVVSSPVYAGSKAFMLRGASLQVGSATHDIDITQDFVLEAYFYLPSGGLGYETQGTIGYNDGYRVQFVKNSTSTFQIKCTGSTNTYGTYNGDQWHKIKLEIDADSHRYRVSIDENVVATVNAGTLDDRNIELWSCNLADSGAIRTIYFDNVKVYSGNFDFSGATVLFFDDFESDTVGQMPAEWAVRYSGESLKVVSSPVYAGSKAFMLRGASLQVGSATHDIDITQDFVLEAYFYLPSGGLGYETQGTIGYNDGYRAQFVKNSTSTFQIKCTGSTNTYGTYNGDQWHKIKLEIDADSHRYRVSIDENVVATVNAGTLDDRNIELWSCNLADSGAIRTIYFDNVKVYSGSFNF